MLRVTTTILASLSAVTLAFPFPNPGQTSLSDLALGKVLDDASEVFGPYTDSKTQLSTWMSRIPDNTPVLHMNIPGAHDISTWNWTQANQDKFIDIIDLEDVPLAPPEFYRCQERSYIDALNLGIRIFDVRYAFDITNTSLITYHTAAMLSERATVPDLMYGFYKFLDDHPSEAIFVSFQYEGGTTSHASNDAAVQLALYDMLTDSSAKKYISQTRNEFGTLGQVRGKVTVLRRFDMDQLPPQYEKTVPGIHFSPANWTDNDPAIVLTYNEEKHLTAYIEDHYDIGDAAPGASVAANIQIKYNDTTANILKAVGPQFKDSLFWSWASSEHTELTPPITPEIMAVGNGSSITPKGGVNNQLLPFFQKYNKQRMGFVMFDYFDVPGNLIETFLNL